MFDIQEELKKLPDKPGVYIMKDENRNIIYVGKAVVLKNRVRQYFQSLSNQSIKVRAMVSKIMEFEYIVTDSELEALILECNLIKKHKPRYNILLKDDKSYPFIKVTMNEEYPRIIMTRKVEKDGGKYFGPYSSVTAVKETIELLKKLFPVKACSKVLTSDAARERPCLNYYIYQCLAPCQGDVNKEEYRALMKDVCSFLGGKQEEIIRRIISQMKAASEEMEFEKAARLRNTINSLKHISEKQKVISTSLEDQDVVAFAKDKTDACVQVFFIRGGKLVGTEHFIFEGMGDADDSEIMSSFIKQFYNSTEYIPREIILQAEIDELNLIERWLQSKRESRVYIKVPRKGDKLHLVEMASQNALNALNQFHERLMAEKNIIGDRLEALSELLNLDALPERIEAYDISNTGSTEMVGSMVVFENGLPRSSEYRRFRIKSIDSQNDYASMQEVIFRRFKHAEKERNDMEHEKDATNYSSGSKDKFSRMPGLILVDGGIGHVNSVSEVLKSIGVDIPVWGMVKDDRHRTRGLVSRDGEIELSNMLPILRFVTAIQDEAHRFAVEYNRKLGKKRYTSSALDEIDGIGEKRRKVLIRHFGSISKIRHAKIDELTAIDGISRTVAEKVYEHFHK